MLKKDIKKAIVDFMNNEGNPTIDISMISTMLEYQNKINKQIEQWEYNDVVQWLQSIHSVSLVSLYSRISIFSRYRDFISHKNGVKMPKININTADLYSSIDYDELLSITISYQEYKYILSQLCNNDVNAQIISARDRVVFELAWLGLTNEGIKRLKKSDIEFTINDIDEEIAVIKLASNQFVTNDIQIMTDLKICIDTNDYIIYSKDNRVKKMTLLDSDYLIRPVTVGRISESDGSIHNPSIILQSLLEKFDITCPNINVLGLSIESIRRSKIIYMLNNENSQYFDVSFVMNLFDITSESIIYFYRMVSEKKYNTE